MHSTSLLPASPFLHRALALATLGCLALAPLGAQTTPAAAPAPETAPVATNPAAGIGAVVETMYEHDFSAGIQNSGNGKLSEDKFGLGLKSTQDWDQNHLVTNLGYSFEHYDFTGVQAPFSSINDLGASVYYDRDIDANWGAFGYIGADDAADSTANFFDSGQIGLAIGPSYKVGQDLTVAIGPMFYTRPEDSSTWTVFGQANWKFAPQWELEGYAGASDGATIAYDIFNNQQTVADATVEYKSRWFEASPVAGLDRSVNETDVVLKFGIRQIFLDHYFARGYVSVLLDREYQFHTGGNSSNSADVNDTVGLGFELGMAF